MATPIASDRIAAQNGHLASHVVSDYAHLGE